MDIERVFTLYAETRKIAWSRHIAHLMDTGIELDDILYYMNQNSLEAFLDSIVCVPIEYLDDEDEDDAVHTWGDFPLWHKDNLN